MDYYTKMGHGIDKVFTRGTVWVKSKPLYNMEKLRVNEYITYILNLKTKIYSICSKIYLPARFNLKYVIKYAA